MRALFEISKSGMHVAERSLSTTAHNLVNANTPGYSRQRVENAPVQSGQPGTNVGLGVRIAQVNRLRNDLIDTQMLGKRMDMGYMQSKAAIFEQLEASLASDSGGDLDVYMGRVFDAFSRLASDPQDISVRNALLSDARQLTDKFSDMSNSIALSSGLAMQDISEHVGEVNKLLKDLAALNKAIVHGQAKGTPDFASLDLQMRKLDQLSEIVGFDKLIAENGSLELRIGGTQVLGSSGASTIRIDADTTTNSLHLRLSDSGKLVRPDGGRLAGSIEMYTREIPALNERLNAIATSFATRVNDIHRTGYGIADENVRNFFDPDFTSAADLRISNSIQQNVRHIASSSVAGESGNGEIAHAMADLRNELAIDGRKFVDAAIGLISAPGSNVNELRLTMETRSSEIRMLEVQQEREAGVNVDEELAMLIQYQNAYQGAARVLSSAQQMYDTLLSIMR